MDKVHDDDSFEEWCTTHVKDSRFHHDGAFDDAYPENLSGSHNDSDDGLNGMLLNLPVYDSVLNKSVRKQPSKVPIRKSGPSNTNTGKRRVNLSRNKAAREQPSSIPVKIPGPSNTRQKWAFSPSQQPVADWPLEQTSRRRWDDVLPRWAQTVPSNSSGPKWLEKGPNYHTTSSVPTNERKLCEYDFPPKPSPRSQLPSTSRRSSIPTSEKKPSSRSQLPRSSSQFS